MHQLEGQPFEAAHAAKIRKTVVGIPGNNAPINPSTINNTTNVRQNKIFIASLNLRTTQYNVQMIYAVYFQTALLILF